MIPTRPRPSPWAARLLAVAAALSLAAPATAPAAVLPGALTVRAEGRAPVQGGRIDTAHRQALDEAFRRGLLDALRVIAPDRQTPQDLETWQETVLTRAGDFVGAWRILSQEQRDGFLNLEVEVEIWRDKLSRAALSTSAASAPPPPRILVLAEPLSLSDPAADEDLDAGRAAAAALEAEFARRGAVVVAATERSGWSGTDAAAAAARRQDADAALVVRVARRDGRIVVAAHLIAAASETTLVSARADVGALGKRSLAEAFAPAARQIVATCAPHLAAASAARARGARP